MHRNRSNEPQLARTRTWQYFVELCGVEPIDSREEAAEDSTVFVEYWIIAVLEKRRLREQRLFANYTATTYAAAEHPVHAPVTVVGAAVAVLAERATELA